jgi:hypothetical protein
MLRVKLATDLRPRRALVRADYLVRRTVQAHDHLAATPDLAS